MYENLHIENYLMKEIILLVIEKIFNFLFSLKIKPTIKVLKLELFTQCNSSNLRFVAIVSNNTSKQLSLCEKYLYFYKEKKLIHTVSVARYEIIHRDGLNILSPIDDIISLAPGEVCKISITDGGFDYKSADAIYFTYFSGAKIFRCKIDWT